MVRVHEKRITQAEAATSLSLSLRQIERIYRRYREEGPSGLASRKRGKVSNRKLSESYRDQVLMLIRKHYYGFGPSFACEKLLEQHGLKVSRETLRR